MKLYIEDGEVLFDYSDVDFEARGLDETEYIRFKRETRCEWTKTLRERVVRMKYTTSPLYSDYDKAYERKELVSNCYYTALRHDYIEISKDFKAYMQELDERYEALRGIEIEKENLRKAEEQWQLLCEHGCGRCKNKQRWGDDFMCAATSDFLPEVNVPKNIGKVHYLFNYEAFPTDNCPFNIKKIKEEFNERLSEACSGSAEA